MALVCGLTSVSGNRDENYENEPLVREKHTRKKKTILPKKGPESSTTDSGVTSVHNQYRENTALPEPGYITKMVCWDEKCFKDTCHLRAGSQVDKKYFKMKCHLLDVKYLRTEGRMLGDQCQTENIQG
jgi:hypothetical protein